MLHCFDDAGRLTGTASNSACAKAAAHHFQKFTSGRHGIAFHKLHKARPGFCFIGPVFTS